LRGEIPGLAEPEILRCGFLIGVSVALISIGFISIGCG